MEQCPPRAGAVQRRGSTLVEFALVSLLLCLVLFGSIELDRMIVVYTAMDDAAREGARYAIGAWQFQIGVRCRMVPAARLLPAGP